jgi:hypothetical protein
MNIFTTDHPMMSVRPLLNRRQRRWLVLALVVYPAYLILLGPLCALDSRNCLNFVPESVRDAFCYPAAPVISLPGDDNFYLAYLDWWCADDNDTTP